MSTAVKLQTINTFKFSFNFFFEIFLEGKKKKKNQSKAPEIYEICLHTIILTIEKKINGTA